MYLLALVLILTTRVAGGGTLIISSEAVCWYNNLDTLILSLVLYIVKILTLVPILTTRVAGGTTLTVSSESVHQDNHLDTSILIIDVLIIEIVSANYSFWGGFSFFNTPRGPPLYFIPQVTPKIKNILKYLSFDTLGSIFRLKIADLLYKSYILHCVKRHVLPIWTGVKHCLI